MGNPQSIPRRPRASRAAVSVTLAAAVIVLFVGIVLPLRSAHDARAYAFFYAKWTSIDNLRLCVNGSTSAPYANQSLTDWNATSTRFGYTGDCGSPQVRFWDWAPGQNGIDGRTTLITDGGSTLVYASIELNISYYPAYSQGARQSVAAHEFGHALGLDHVGGYAVMLPVTCSGSGTRWCWYGIQTPVGDDVQGINARYP